MRSSSAGSSTISRPLKRPTTSAVRSSAVGPRPPLVTISARPSSRMNRSAASRSWGRSPTIWITAASTPSSRRRSDSHGPLRSEMIPVRTSVPVMRIPARGRSWRRLPSCALGLLARRQHRVRRRGEVEADGAAGRRHVTDTPLTFILTDALPRVSSSLEEVFTGIVCPTLKISPGISFLPVPSTRQTYTAPVGTSWSLTVDATVRVRGARWCVALW